MPAPLSTDLDINLNDPMLFLEGRAHEAFRRLRKEAPVHWNPGTETTNGFWSVTKYEDLLFGRDGAAGPHRQGACSQSSIMTSISSPGFASGTSSGMMVSAFAALILVRMPLPWGPVRSA